MSNLREGWCTRVDDAVHGVAVVGMDGRVLHANRAACLTLGVDEQLLVGRRLTDLLHIDDAPGERRYVRPDGAVVWLLIDTRVEGDDARRVLVEIRDVTGPRRVAEAERATSGRYHTTIEGSWVVDAAGATVSISAAAAEMLGYHPDEIRGRSPAEFVDPADAVALQEAIARRQAGRRETYELRWRRRDGEMVWALMAAAPMRDADGRYAGSFGLVTDVTDRRRAEERLACQVRRQEAVASLGRLALEGADRERLLDAAVRVSADVLRADFAAILACEDDRLRPVAVHGLPAGAVRDLAMDTDESAPAASQLAAGEPVIVADWEHCDRIVPPWVREFGVRSSAAVPVRGRALHAVFVAARRSAWAADDDEVRYLEAVANVLASAIDRDDVEVEGRERALHDPLTGLPNRTLALDRLDHALRRCDDDAGVVGVLSVDVDRFKHVNDTYGVAAGDEVVRAVAERLVTLVRPADTVARLAGDSFVIVCEDLADDDAAAATAARIVEAMRTPVRIGDLELALTVSVGVAVAGGTDHRGAGDLLRDADAAMDRAKAQGRDGFELFDEALRARAADRVQLESDLRHAVARRQLAVAHQPIVSVATGHVIATEALVRWHHPERGVVSPVQFIGVAEETGLIGEIGAWVLRQACEDVAALHRMGRPLTCHVNLSPRQALDEQLPDLVAEVLRDTGLPPESLVLELTESALMETGEGPLAVLQSIHDLGVRLVLDDFGTGYSSLGRLRRFPIDGLKIDRSFVADLDGFDPGDALLVSGLVELARALGLTVVAEGVETPLQLSRLERIGCRYAQGFLLARPCDTVELDRLLTLDSLLPAAAT